MECNYHEIGRNEILPQQLEFLKKIVIDAFEKVLVTRRFREDTYWKISIKQMIREQHPIFFLHACGERALAVIEEAKNAGMNQGNLIVQLITDYIYNRTTIHFGAEIDETFMDTGIFNTVIIGEGPYVNVFGQQGDAWHPSKQVTVERIPITQITEDDSISTLMQRYGINVDGLLAENRESFLKNDLTVAWEKFRESTRGELLMRTPKLYRYTRHG